MKYRKGALDSSYDIRDFWYEPADRGELVWDFDIETKVGKITTKDQNGSSSCGGQAWSYYGEVLEAIATGTYEPRSARWIYATTAVQGGGSRGKDNSDFVVKNGFALEKDAPSYDDGKPPRESFMLKKPVLSETGIEVATSSKAMSYLKLKPDIDTIAHAIVENNGVILSVGGEDNGTWRSSFPKPPSYREWGHWVYAGKLKIIKSKKYIGIKNSWGNDTGEDGWQWLGEDYFKSGFIREGWTLAWDYTPPKSKVFMVEIIRLLKEIITLIKTK